MRAELKHLHRELGTTTICVTHDQIEAMTLASRIAVVNKGTSEQFGSPQEIHEESENLFVARLVGTPPMSLIRDQIDSGVSKETMRLEDLPDAKADAGEVVPGIRPDHVLLTGAERGDLQGRVFSMECTGSELRVTLKAGTMLAELTACPAIDGTIGVRFERSWVHAPDVDSGCRVHMDVAGGRRA